MFIHDKKENIEKNTIELLHMGLTAFQTCFVETDIECFRVSTHESHVVIWRKMKVSVLKRHERKQVNKAIYLSNAFPKCFMTWDHVNNINFFKLTSVWCHHYPRLWFLFIFGWQPWIFFNFFSDTVLLSLFFMNLILSRVYIVTAINLFVNVNDEHFCCNIFLPTIFFFFFVFCL